MKIEKKPEFVPVAITLESQLEVDALYVIVGRIAQGGSDVDMMQWYNALSSFVSNINKPLVRVEAASLGIGLRLEKNSAA